MLAQGCVMQGRLPQFIKSVYRATLVEKLAYQIRITRFRGTTEFRASIQSSIGRSRNRFEFGYK